MDYYFDDMVMGPDDPILGIAQRCRADPNPDKINVGVGAYRDDNGKPWILPSVQQAKDILYKDPHQDHEYLPIEGYQPFIDAALKLAYGDDAEVITNKRVLGLQSLSGTGSLRLIATFLERHMQRTASGALPTVYVSDPTWSNHYQIFEHCNFVVKPHRYWDASTKGLNFTGMCEDIENAPDGSIFILHACAHNPTGVDPTAEQWKQISQVCLKKKHFIIFDSAYQGFASGSTTHDIAAVRQFVQDGHCLALAQSFAKNFGLYSERVGLASLVLKDTKQRDLVMSNIKICARGLYSNPPSYGAKIVATVLNNPELKAVWAQDVTTMCERILAMRQTLHDKLTIELKSEHNWDHLTQQIGMFSFTGLSKEQSKRLTDEFHIYLTLNGRISIAGINTKNVDTLARAIHAVTTTAHDEHKAEEAKAE